MMKRIRQEKKTAPGKEEGEEAQRRDRTASRSTTPEEPKQPPLPPVPDDCMKKTHPFGTAGEEFLRKAETTPAR